MSVIELYVELKGYDATEITAFQVLKRLGFSELEKLKRREFYSFGINADAEKFKEKISAVDLLVNANKHLSSFELDKNSGAVFVKVQNELDDCSRLLKTLKQRLDFGEIESLKRGILWGLQLRSKNKLEMVKQITEILLVNKNFQNYQIIKGNEREK